MVALQKTTLKLLALAAIVLSSSEPTRVQAMEEVGVQGSGQTPPGSGTTQHMRQQNTRATSCCAFLLGLAKNLLPCDVAALKQVRLETLGNVKQVVTLVSRLVGMGKRATPAEAATTDESNSHPPAEAATTGGSRATAEAATTDGSDNASSEEKSAEIAEPAEEGTDAGFRAQQAEGEQAEEDINREVRSCSAPFGAAPLEGEPWKENSSYLLQFEKTRSGASFGALEIKTMDASLTVTLTPESLLTLRKKIATTAPYKGLIAPPRGDVRLHQLAMLLGREHGGAVTAGEEISGECPFDVEEDWGPKEHGAYIPMHLRTVPAFFGSEVFFRTRTDAEGKMEHDARMLFGGSQFFAETSGAENERLPRDYPILAVEEDAQGKIVSAKFTIDTLFVLPEPEEARWEMMQARYAAYEDDSQEALMWKKEHALWPSEQEAAAKLFKQREDRGWDQGRPQLLDLLGSGLQEKNLHLGGNQFYGLRASHSSWSEQLETDAKWMILHKPEVLNCPRGTNSRGRDMTPLYLACRNENVPLSIVKAMVLAGARLRFSPPNDESSGSLVSHLRSVRYDRVSDERIDEIKRIFDEAK